MGRRWKGLALAASLATCVGACGDGKEDTGGEDGLIIDACALVSQGEAEGVVEAALTPAQSSEQPAVGLKLCLYESQDLASGVFLEVGLTQLSFFTEESIAAGNTPTTLFSSIRDAWPDRMVVEDLGDEAFIASPGIHVLAWDHYITVTLGNTDDPVNQERLVSAGHIAVGHLEEILGL